MTRTGRIAAFLAAAAVAVVAAVLLTGGADDVPTTAQTPTTTPTATPTREPQEAEPRATPEAEEEPEARAFSAATLLAPGRDRTLTFTTGDRVRFRVRSPQAEELHVHGYDITRALPAGRTVTVSFDGELEGIFEVELHGSGERIGRLRVEPA